MTTMKKHSTAVACFVLALCMASCKKDKADQQDRNIAYGNTITIGSGQARSYLANKNNSNQMELGIEMDAGCLQGLPAAESNFLIDLPSDALALTPYRHISMDWTPHGHGPASVYDKPHFDIHFFMIGRDAQNAIDVNDPAMQRVPDSTFMPSFYIPEPLGISKMGKHWVDATSPELNPVNPAPFTTTMVYGTYDAKVVFLEPMITRAYLLSQPDTAINIRQPQSFAVSGHYPNRYKIRFDKSANKIYVALIDFLLK
jgi:hypothetical protein